LAEYVQLPDGRKVELPADPAQRAALREKIRTKYSSAATAPAPAMTPQQKADAAIQKSTERQDTGYTKFGRGLLRVPDAAAGVVPGLGDAVDAIRGTPGQTREAARTAGAGAAEGVEAFARGVTDLGGDTDDRVIAAIRNPDQLVNAARNIVTPGKPFDTSRLDADVKRSKERGRTLKKEKPVSSLAGNVVGFGAGGAALRTGTTAATGGKVALGLGGEAAAVTGAASLLEGNDAGEAATNALVAMVGGKALQGVADKALTPGMKWIAGRLDTRLKGGEISPAVIAGIANRTGRPAEEIANAVEAFTFVNKRPPSLVEIADDATIQKFAELAKSRQGVAGVFRESEEAALASRPAEVKAAVEATGETRLGTDEIAARRAAAEAQGGAVAAQTDEAVGALKTTAADDAVRVADEARAGRRDLRGQAAAVTDDATARIRQLDDEARRVQAEATDTQRMVRDESAKLVDEQAAKIEQTGEELRQSLLKSSAVEPDMQTSEIIEAQTKAWADDIMQNKETGLETLPVRIGPRVYKRDIPELEFQKALKDLVNSTSKGDPAYPRLLAAKEAADSGKAIELTIRDLDTIRRVFKERGNSPGGAGLKKGLDKAGDALERLAATQHKQYGRFLNKYEELKQVAEGFKVGQSATGAGAQKAAANLRAAESAYTKAGGKVGVLAKINEQLSISSKPLNDAADLVARREALVSIAGSKGAKIADDSMEALMKVQGYADEIAAIKEAARNTREGVAKEAKGKVAAIGKTKQAVGDEATAKTRELGKQAEGLTDAARSKIRELKQKAGAEIAKLRKAQADEETIIKRALAADEDALRAADNVLSARNTDFDAAVSGGDAALPTGAVARRAIADEAGQSPVDALKTAERLRDTATTGRVARVAGEETAETLRAIGASQTKAASNQSIVSVRDPKEGNVVSDEVSAAVAAAATLAGRAGVPFAFSAVQRVINRAGRLNLSDKQANALARAVTSRDPKVVKEVLDKLVTTQRTRAQIDAAMQRIVVGLTSSQVVNMRKDSSVSYDETQAAITDLMANGYSREDAEALVEDTNALIRSR